MIWKLLFFILVPVNIVILVSELRANRRILQRVSHVMYIGGLSVACYAYAFFNDINTLHVIARIGYLVVILGLIIRFVDDTKHKRETQASVESIEEELR